MFKIIVLCTLLVSVSCFPSHHEGVDKVDVAVETEPQPQVAAVPIEQALKATVHENKEAEPVPATPLKAAEPVVASLKAAEPVVAPLKAAEPVVAPANVAEPVVSENVADESGNDNKKTLGLLLIKFTTTAATTPATPAM